MKEFLNIMGKDILEEDFCEKDYFIYGCIYPLLLVAICLFADFLNML